MDRVHRVEEQRQVGATGRPPEGADATTERYTPYKQFATALDKDYSAFKTPFLNCLRQKFKAGVLVGPQIKKIPECKEFPRSSLGRRKQLGTALSQRFGYDCYLGDHKAENSE